MPDQRPIPQSFNNPDAGKITPAQARPELGYEASDVKVRGVLVFLVSLGAFVLVFFVFCFGMGKVINNALVKQDGPPNKWNVSTAAPHKRGKTLASTEVMEQQQLATMTQRFPTPRLQMDDGNQDLADMHQKEDLLLDHYTWVDKQQGVVRIPIEQAMQTIVDRGLPVMPGASATGDASTMDDASKISAPLTNGFARTTYEQDEQTQQNVIGQRKPGSDSASSKPQPAVKPETKIQAGGIQ